MTGAGTPNCCSIFSKTALFLAMRARPLSMRNFAAMRSENSRKLCEKTLCLRSLLMTFWSRVTPSSAAKARGEMPFDRASERNSESQRSKLPEFVHAAPSFAAAASKRLTKIAREKGLLMTASGSVDSGSRPRDKRDHARKSGEFKTCRRARSTCLNRNRLKAEKLIDSKVPEQSPSKRRGLL